ncbi:hypothetical protein Back11_05660 [Paenibacillus baekrokdamisoli]|uniref:Uncharacterized protein n=1 Tax=Paenibacillus baekrokdamisoli TaxID=1712516 RepID=A0A3G9J003_9BACL|nr:hypothetical protein Back11_05660 [Paenibacillus baekrokdamisoli]
MERLPSLNSIIFGPENMDYNMRDLLVEDLNGYRLCFGDPTNPLRTVEQEERYS